jgi:tetratricopeptide (TPR) repeat protein
VKEEISIPVKQEVKGSNISVSNPVATVISPPVNEKPHPNYYLMGENFLKEGKASQAEELFRKAIEVDPTNSLAYTNLGWACAIQKKDAEAEEAYKQVTRLTPDNGWAYVTLGYFYLRRKPIASEEAFKKAIEIAPNNYQVHIQAGICFKALLKYTDAESAFKRAIALEPKNDEGYLELGSLYAIEKSYAMAERAFKEAIRLNGNNERAYGSLIAALYEMRRYREAEEFQKKMNNAGIGFYYSQAAIANYHRIYEILKARGIQLVCIQYPMCKVDSLKMIFDPTDKIIFVDNEKTFLKEVRKNGYTRYFVDDRGGNFGHLAKEGNRILAEDIARVLSREYFRK